ncbi:PfkB family carbohydrate kinase [Lentilactobacillus buchneri]|uniref:PfkB family carbohydrate kinase n=1 Tax=Lentilactobacillus buchneri TaxID=1581 RepID=UPI0012927087|nr:PfkB family carbohydrate kinase [Lentilactobacillus buchneri]MQM78764.1 ribokinase [Lentilactobacillus buchneri]MQM86533.1 ribokinase [Lentilactobacillus buchneri]MQN20935.1 ribokinase [Lentilactobacillus buchneri]
MSAKKVLVLGGAVVDVVVTMDKLPKSGQDLVAKYEQTVIGGNAMNVSHVMNELGQNHNVFIPTGKGPYADLVKRQLEKDGYYSLIQDDSKDCGWNLSIVEKDGERTFISIPGVESNWKSEWFKKLDITQFDLIYCSAYSLQGESGRIVVNALEKKNPAAKVFFDAGPRIGFIKQDLIDEILSLNTVLHVNRDEVKMMSGNSDIESGAKALFNQTNQPVIVTLDAKGSLLIDDEESRFINPFKAKVTDTIGAGDSHTAAMLVALAQGNDMAESVKFGNRVASEMVQQQGARLVLSSQAKEQFKKMIN